MPFLFQGTKNFIVGLFILRRAVIVNRFFTNRLRAIFKTEQDGQHFLLIGVKIPIANDVLIPQHRPTTFLLRLMNRKVWCNILAHRQIIRLNSASLNALFFEYIFSKFVFLSFSKKVLKNNRVVCLPYIFPNIIAFI